MVTAFADACHEADGQARFIAVFFAGGALGSQLGSVAYHADGWNAVTAQGAVLPVLAPLYWLTERRTR
ncbi:hypothetical protein [Streptomyces gilvus]|uniref:hypothetical protein n=1 Tax=Streptomyces gilvus TaxID=2920937 RepID=UPI001F0DEBFB|nr:hypothetical protein [Streptomyces sp. CME 23]MCH5677393.1 hypothetical protein [Streptomyces sp. CME 23]